MTSEASIKITDTGWSLPGDLLALDDIEIQAGVLEGADAHDGITTASLLLLHEDGAPRANIPARPVVRPTWDSQVGEYEDAMDSVAMAAARGSADKELVGLADKMADDIRKTITERRAGGPPLKASTLEGQQASLRRLGNTPLVDTGALLEAINGQVVKGSKGGPANG